MENNSLSRFWEIVLTKTNKRDWKYKTSLMTHYQQLFGVFLFQDFCLALPHAYLIFVYSCWMSVLSLRTSRTISKVSPSPITIKCLNHLMRWFKHKAYLRVSIISLCCSGLVFSSILNLLIYICVSLFRTSAAFIHSFPFTLVFPSRTIQLSSVRFLASQSVAEG